LFPFTQDCQLGRPCGAGIEVSSHLPLVGVEFRNSLLRLVGL